MSERFNAAKAEQPRPDSVGQKAKAAIAQAQDSGEAPANLQGKVATPIARDVDFTVLLPILPEGPPPVEAPPPADIA